MGDYDITTKYPITTSLTVTVAAGSDTSDIIDTHGVTMCGLIVRNLIGESFTLELSVDGTNFYPFYRAAGTKVSFIINQNSWIGVCPQDLAGARYIKIKAGEVQLQERTLTVILNTTGSI